MTPDNLTRLRARSLPRELHPHGGRVRQGVKADAPAVRGRDLAGDEDDTGRSDPVAAQAPLALVLGLTDRIEVGLSAVVVDEEPGRITGGLRILSPVGAGVRVGLVEAGAGLAVSHFPDAARVDGALSAPALARRRPRFPTASPGRRRRPPRGSSAPSCPACVSTWKERSRRRLPGTGPRWIVALSLRVDADLPRPRG